MDDEWISFIDDIFALNDRNKANLLAKELLNINASAADTPESCFSTFMKFSRVSLENTSHNSMNDVLDYFYKVNLSYIKDPKVKGIMLLVKSHGKPKIFNMRSLADVEDLLNILENNGEKIISKLIYKDGSEAIIKHNMLNPILDIEIVFKIHAAICALREIAYLRSRPKDKIDGKMMERIVRIVLYSNGQILKLDNLLSKPVVQDLVASLKGSENINKRWEPLNNLKKESVEFADNLWSKGDKKLHNEMAIYTYKNIKKNHGQLIKDIIGKDAISEACEDAFSKACKDLISNKKLKREDAIFNACKDIISKVCKNISSSSDEKLKREDLISEACKNISDDEKLIIKEIFADKFLIKAIRKAIIPIAEKYDRVRGIKGPQNK